MENIHTLSNKVYSEPTSKILRPFVIDYIRYYIDEAKQLSPDDILRSKGSVIASKICGALAWQGARGVAGENWITEADEPILSKILDVASYLDINADNPDKWHDLFVLVENLK